MYYVYCIYDIVYGWLKPYMVVQSPNGLGCQVNIPLEANSTSCNWDKVR